MNQTIDTYLDLMDSQRESVFSMLDGITDAQLWQRPEPGEWSIGEILDHNYLLFAFFHPVVKLIWHWLGWYGRWKRKRPYTMEIEDLYRSPKFPQWVGFMWTPRFNPRKPVTLKQGAGEPFVYAYYEGIDKVSHEYGLAEHYDAELRATDRLVADFVDCLPPGRP